MTIGAVIAANSERQVSIFVGTLPFSTYIYAEATWTQGAEDWLGSHVRMFGTFKSVADLEAAIDAWIAAWNANPTPFKWSAKASAIIEKTARARQVLEHSNSGTK